MGDEVVHLIDMTDVSLITMIISLIEKGEVDMELTNILRPEFVILVFFLSGLGTVLKYRTPLSNNLIPLVLFCVAFCIAASRGFVHATEARMFEALVEGGLVNGGTATAISVFGWDFFFGIYKKGQVKGGSK